jgi:SAM-dependent MidA family methyltransferase
MTCLVDPDLPEWLRQRLLEAGGSVPFRTYMEWALHDPQHGAYGSGRLRIGRRGDFVTSPSLGSDFAALLAPQLAEWLGELAIELALDPDGDRRAPGAGPEASRPLALVETGPGEGELALQLAQALVQGWPELAAHCELVLVEPNGGMAARQQQRLERCPLPCRWCSAEELAQAPCSGVVLAHEVLDALAVERIRWDGRQWRQQRVALHQAPGQAEGLHLVDGESLEPKAEPALEQLGLWPPDPRRCLGWTTELHPGLAPWLAGCAAGLKHGRLLVIDYALPAERYYAPQRPDGTLMAYRQQEASGDPLRQPGFWDLTAHLCSDSLLEAARQGGWSLIGQRSQGEALLALGLAQRLHGLQTPAAGQQLDLATALGRRESLLRLVDPAGLGAFRWFAFSRAGVPAPPPALEHKPEASLLPGEAVAPGSQPPGRTALPLFLRDP